MQVIVANFSPTASRGPGARYPDAAGHSATVGVPLEGESQLSNWIEDPPWFFKLVRHAFSWP